MAHSMSSQREQYKESTKLDGYALDLRCLPNVAVWLNSNNNKAITEKQDKELFKKKIGLYENFTLEYRKSIYICESNRMYYLLYKHVRTFYQSFSLR